MITDCFWVVFIRGHAVGMGEESQSGLGCSNFQAVWRQCWYLAKTQLKSWFSLHILFTIEIYDIIPSYNHIIICWKNNGSILNTLIITAVKEY